MTAWTDAQSRRLSDYPHPSAAVDIAVLTYVDGILKVLAVEHDSGQLALPGTFLRETPSHRERFAEAADRALRDKSGLTGVRFHQLRVFDEPDRDDRGWVISMAHTAVVPARDLPEDAVLLPISDGGVTVEIAFDHADMVRLAVEDLRSRYTERVDPDGLLGEAFTVFELRALYETIFDRSLQKDSFRRHVIDALESTGESTNPGSGRPAELFRQRGEGRLPAKAGVLLAG